MGYRNNDMQGLKPTSYRTYFLRSLVLLLVLALVIAMMYGFLSSGDENLLRGVLIGLGVFSFLAFSGYWVYIVLRETNIRRALSSPDDASPKALRKKRLAILKAYRAQAKARGERLTDEVVEDIRRGKYDSEA